MAYMLQEHAGTHPTTGDRYPIATLIWMVDGGNGREVSDLCIQTYDAPSYSAGSTIQYRVKNVAGYQGRKIEFQTKASSFDPNTLVSAADGSVGLRIDGRDYADGEDYAVTNASGVPSTPNSCASGGKSGINMFNVSSITAFRALRPNVAAGYPVCMYADLNTYCKESTTYSNGGSSGGNCAPPGPGGSSFDGSPQEGHRTVRKGAPAVYVEPAGGGNVAQATDPTEPFSLVDVRHPIMSLDIRLCDGSVVSFAKTNISRVGAQTSLRGVLTWSDCLLPVGARTGDIPAQAVTVSLLGSIITPYLDDSSSNRFYTRWQVTQYVEDDEARLSSAGGRRPLASGRCTAVKVLGDGSITLTFVDEFGRKDSTWSVDRDLPYVFIKDVFTMQSVASVTGGTIVPLTAPSDQIGALPLPIILGEASDEYKAVGIDGKEPEIPLGICKPLYVGNFRVNDREMHGYAVSLYAMSGIPGLFGSDRNPTCPVNVRIDDSTIGAENRFLVPGHNSFTWPFTERHVTWTVGTKTYWVTMFFAEGPISQDHVDGKVPLSCNVLGPDSVGRGLGGQAGALNLLTNGNFDRDPMGGVDTNWATTGTVMGGVPTGFDGASGWSWDGSKAVKTPGVEGCISVSVSAPMVAPRIVFTISGRTAGSVQIFLRWGYGSAPYRVTNGTFMIDLNGGDADIFNDDALILRATDDFDGSIDDVRFWENEVRVIDEGANIIQFLLDHPVLRRTTSGEWGDVARFPDGTAIVRTSDFATIRAAQNLRALPVSPTYATWTEDLTNANLTDDPATAGGWYGENSGTVYDPGWSWDGDKLVHTPGSAGAMVVDRELLWGQLTTNARVMFVLTCTAGTLSVRIGLGTPKVLTSADAGELEVVVIGGGAPVVLSSQNAVVFEASSNFAGSIDRVHIVSRLQTAAPSARYRHAIIIDRVRSAREWLAEAFVSTGITPHIDHRGRIGAFTTYNTDLTNLPRLTENEIQDGTFELTSNLHSQLENERSYEGGPEPSSGRTTVALTKRTIDRSVTDWGDTYKGPQVVLVTCYRPEVARSIIAYMLLDTQDGVTTGRFTTDLRGCDFQAGEIIQISNRQGLGTSGWTRRYVRVLSRTVQVEETALSVVVEWEDRQNLLGRRTGMRGPDTGGSSIGFRPMGTVSGGTAWGMGNIADRTAWRMG